MAQPHSQTAFQFPGARFDHLSVATTPIELLFRGERFAHGTGFLWRLQNRRILITNWHNVSGQNPFDGTHLNVGGRVPDEIIAHVARRTSGRPMQTIEREPVHVQLYQHFDEPAWTQHRHFDTLRVDVVAIELPGETGDYPAVNQFGYDRLFTGVGSDVLIVGYPFLDLDGVMLPIWKRGSIASEPLAGWQNKPMFLIDAASRPGMSGSPVFRRVFGPAPVLVGEGIEMKLDRVVTTEFVGVYAGHLNTKQADVTIGFAWYAKLVDEILADPRPGTRL